jgi:hypothetical protein
MHPYMNLEAAQLSPVGSFFSSVLHKLSLARVQHCTLSCDLVCKFDQSHRKISKEKFTFLCKLSLFISVLFKNNCS